MLMLALPYSSPSFGIKSLTWLASPHLHDVAESCNVNDVPSDAHVDRVYLHRRDAVAALQSRVFEQDGAISIAFLVRNLHCPTHATGSVPHECSKLDHGFKLCQRSTCDAMLQDLRLVVTSNLQPLAKAL
eukprot:CAMPEP_0168452830 /NCGR_PEP_ID=MMETSP0228-20121227/49367_1 /TAXON_ID=133427 /ORGANISM="Protoceratium reticulatum, Strain CCCM 535 (=CCMP 1889)" /LENGTH=129 /DNA_ID=CAMNT_0008467517 /DNA_START=57 /DNA_END=446 /DNA_ORIENTATION=-